MHFWHEPPIWKTKSGTSLKRQITMKKSHIQFTRCVYMARDALRVLVLRGKTFPSTLRSELRMKYSRLSLSLRKNLFLRLSIFRYGMFSLRLRQAVLKMQTTLFNAILLVRFNYVLWLVLEKGTAWTWLKRLSAAMKEGFMVMMRASTPKSLMKRLRGRSKT